MVEPLGDHPTVLRHLVEEAAELRERLHRITVALGITEDMVADVYEKLAGEYGPESAMLRVQAQAARATADECRRFARHLDEVHGRNDGDSAGAR